MNRRAVWQHDIARSTGSPHGNAQLSDRRARTVHPDKVPFFGEFEHAAVGEMCRRLPSLRGIRDEQSARASLGFGLIYPGCPTPPQHSCDSEHR